MTGEKILNMPEVHELTVTAIVFLEERSYLITASKDHCSTPLNISLYKAYNRSQSVEPQRPASLN